MQAGLKPRKCADISTSIWLFCQHLCERSTFLFQIWAPQEQPCWFTREQQGSEKETAGSCCDDTIATPSTPATVLGKGWVMLWPILLPPCLPLLMTSLIPTARHTQPGSTHSARSSVFITFKCGFVTNRTKDRREKMLRIYCLYHSSVNLLFISLLCESTVYFTPLYSTPLWVYCLFHSSVSLLSIPLLCESTVYSTLLWVYCLFHSSVSLLFISLLCIPLLCESTVYSTPPWVYCLFHSSVSLLFIPLLR